MSDENPETEASDDGTDTETITIEQATRLEGHAKIDIHLDDDGAVDRAYFQATELRGFEEFVQGRQLEEIPRIAPRICGVCPWPHHLASTKAVEDAWDVRPTETAVAVRRLLYSVANFADHLVHFYYLAAPDFVMGPDAAPDVRNVLELAEMLDEDLVTRVARTRREAHELLESVAGRAIHPVFGVPGGVSNGIDEGQRDEIAESLAGFVDLAEQSLELFEDLVLGDDSYRDLVTGEDVYYLRTNYVSLVDDDGVVDFYGDDVRVIAPEGTVRDTRPADEFDRLFGERAEPWSYPTLPYLRSEGWSGLDAANDDSLYQVGPLARINVSDGFSTPRAHSWYETFFDVLPQPCHHTLAAHWARLIEMLYLAERAEELIQTPAVVGDDRRRIPADDGAGSGVGAVEAARGTLFHSYTSTADGTAETVNCLVPTNHNIPSINRSIERAATALVDGSNPDEGTLNRVEMAFRAYDPCLACATHSVVGETPLAVRIYDADGNRREEYS
ncbi:Ni/Fe hydrogenase subunit alpha [Natronobacterium gregoryi]|nr:Ni/Fe hydrogenase subunit alpha [Natronobacterium gregoryi]AFZ74004.1 coenzyme F420-reducing hydrogenase, alpha subunit [Natronobacterium gregoryi SP2]PLK20753.1 Ni/Fe hydrogenase subunit alpha [Natronobacterium gregoryi SP2]SFJ07972.1 F420-non-reducing hydrogenase subunit A [Natronobacterium gregoryi]